MESTTLSATLFTVSKTLNSTTTTFHHHNPLLLSRHHRHLLCSATPPHHHSPHHQCLRSHLAVFHLRRLCASEIRRRASSCAFGSVSGPPTPLRSLYAIVASPPVGSSAACFASCSAGGGGGGVGGSGGGGGGDETSGGGNAESGAEVADEVSGLSTDVIILDVSGMTCGGCAASVKRILESQSQVSSASVNLATETAIVWPASEAKVVPNWQKHLGETLAKHLTSCGFTSNLRGQEAIEGEIPS